MVFGSTWREVARGRVERVDRRKDAERGDVARQHHRRVEVGEGGRGRGVGQVVGRHVDRLHRGDRAGLGRRDALLQLAHLLGEGGLVAHGRRHAAEQRRHFDAGERIAVDIVDEQQDVAPLVAKVLGHGEAGESHAESVARRLVHLAEDHGHLGLGDVLRVDDLGLDHLVVEVVALARPLAHAGEHR